MKWGLQWGGGEWRKYTGTHSLLPSLVYRNFSLIYRCHLIPSSDTHKFATGWLWMIEGVCVCTSQLWSSLQMVPLSANNWCLFCQQSDWRTRQFEIGGGGGDICHLNLHFRKVFAWLYRGRKAYCMKSNLLYNKVLFIPLLTFTHMSLLLFFHELSQHSTLTYTRVKASIAFNIFFWMNIQCQNLYIFIEKLS